MSSLDGAGDRVRSSRTGRRLLCFAAIAHLTIAAGFALVDSVSRFTSRFPLAVALPLRLYGAITGGTAGYGFFSPDISPEIRARFEIVTPAGRRPVTLTGSNHEADLRIGNLVNSQWDLRKKEQSLDNNRAIAASCAGKIFALHPDASAVDVVVEYYDLPSMERFRAGAPARWVPYYSTSFARPAGATPP